MGKHTPFWGATESENIQAAEAEALMQALGYTAIYGGGQSQKGHGYWIQKDGITVKNDGKRSGNPCFWMCDDLITMLKGQPR